MNKNYSQFKAMLAVTKASLLATFREPSTVVFGLLFPFIFIIIFGFLGQGGTKVHVAIKKDFDEQNPIYKTLDEIETIDFVKYEDENLLDADLKKGKIDGLLEITGTNSTGDASGIAQYKIDVTTTNASPDKGQILNSMISSVADKTNIGFLKEQFKVKDLGIVLNTNQVEGRKFKTIDFILPGQLGFSLLSIGVFGTAFVFVNLRETLVLKRFFATPIRKSHILIGEGLSRLIFAAIQATVIIGVGTFFMGYTLVNGFATLFSMLFLAILGLIIFMGFGFVISGVAKSENTVPPLANIVTLPQFLLSGTFFSTEAFPSWLKPISDILPLTYLNDAMRKVAFEGLSLIDVAQQIGILFIWGIVVYLVAIKFFKWEA